MSTDTGRMQVVFRLRSWSSGKSTGWLRVPHFRADASRSLDMHIEIFIYGIEKPPNEKSYCWLIALARTFLQLAFLPVSPFTDHRAQEKPLHQPSWLL